jgi:HK97 family phage major capsid protein
MTTTLDRFAPRTDANPQGALYRDFAVRVETREDAPDGDTRIAIAISSEAAVERYDWQTGDRYLEVLDHSTKGPDLTYARDGLPFCLDHSLSRQIGLLEDVRVDEDGVIRGLLREGNHPDAAWAIADMRAGIRRKVSIGYWPGTQYETEQGRRGTVPTRRYTGWMLYEASTVAVPADYDVGVGRDARGIAPTNTTSPAAGETPHTQEATMDEKDTSERGAAPAPDTRPQELAALANDAGMAERGTEWILKGTSVADARREVMQTLRERADKGPQIATSAPAVTGVKDRAEDKPWEASEFFRAVVVAGRGGSQDVRLRAQNTQIGEEGGFAVPQPVVNMLLEATLTGGQVLSRVSTRPVTAGNSYTETIVKEEARTNGSRNGGVRAYWLAEDGTYQESQAGTRQIDLKLQKLGALVRITDEQAEDGPALMSFVQEQVPEELRFVAENAVWEGLGSGQPLGFMNSGALISVTIESGQTIANTNTHIWMNAAKMYTRLPTRMLAGAAWFVNQALWSKILTSTAGAAGSHPMFTPAGRLNDAPFGALYGLPIVPVEYASAEGTVGDFVLANLSDYLLITKGGIRQASSMHVDFLRDRQVLKFTWRVNGAPRTRTPLSPFKGADTLSPYVALAARS